jgi:3-hydroxyisobutyrate dehydrogenase
MCGHLVDAGYAVTIHTRTRARAESLLQRGASWADSPAEVAKTSDVIFSIVGFPDDVRAVMFGAGGVLEGVRPHGVIVDMTTSEPALASEVYEAAKERRAFAVDAPVSGGDIGAINATLSIMVGGELETFERIRPLLEHIGQTIVYHGRAGSGQHTKLVNQIAICSGMIGVCEALLYGYKAGLDLRRVLESIASGAAGSWSLSNYGPRILDGDFEPGFFVDHFIKDMGIALAEARRMKLALPGLALAHQLYVALDASGGGKNGTHALLLALARLSNLEWGREARGEDAIA